MLQSLIPGMEYGENADASTEAVSIGGDLHQSLGNRTKQQSVDKTLVSECECSQLLRLLLRRPNRSSRANALSLFRMRRDYADSDLSSWQFHVICGPV